MAVVSFSSAKGGVGKTTLAVNIAAEFALRGIPTTVLDCDLNQHASLFGQMFLASNPGVPLAFIGGVTKNNIIQNLKRASADADVVIIDLPAGTSELSLRAIIKSHLVVIPSQRTALDAKDAARTALQIAEASELSGQDIASVLVWTMVGTQFETGTERFVREGLMGMMTDPERAVLKAPLLRYDAFPAGFVHGFVPSQVAANAGKVVVVKGPGGERSVKVPSSAHKAAENITAIADGILERLKLIGEGRNPGRVALIPEVVEQIRRAPAVEVA